MHDSVKRPFLRVNATSQHVHGDFTVSNQHECKAALAEPCAGCAAAASLARRDVDVKFTCLASTHAHTQAAALTQAAAHAPAPAGDGGATTVTRKTDRRVGLLL